MPVEVVWLDQAKDDLQDILQYLYPRNPSAALTYIDGLEDACQQLLDFPKLGWLYNERYRALVVGNHVVFYSFDEIRKVVRIVSIIDGRRDIANVLDDSD